MPYLVLKADNLSYEISGRRLFSGFSLTLCAGERIAVIGENGVGKSTLLKIISGELAPSSGSLILFTTQWVYVPQTIEKFPNKSGAERFNTLLNFAIAEQPHTLILDEPSKHLDAQNRISLIIWLSRFNGTLIFASHDEKLIRCVSTKLWIIEDEKITVFSGTLDEWKTKKEQNQKQLQDELEERKIQERESLQKRQREEEQALPPRSKNEKKFEQEKWDTLKRGVASSSPKTRTKKEESQSAQEEKTLSNELKEIRSSHELVLHFHLTSAKAQAGELLVQVENGAFGWKGHRWLKEGLNVSVSANQVLLISGRNGSGKSSFIQALLGKANIQREGEWFTVPQEEIGILDQHYANLKGEHTVQENLKALVPSWSEKELRKHLFGYLFQSNEDVNKKALHLSGGEKVLLSLALLGAKTPLLLILDELTNNMDRRTRLYVQQAILGYPGSLILTSHDAVFLHELYSQDKREWKEISFP